MITFSNVLFDMIDEEDAKRRKLPTTKNNPDSATCLIIENKVVLVFRLRGTDKTFWYDKTTGDINFSKEELFDAFKCMYTDCSGTAFMQFLFEILETKPYLKDLGTEFIRKNIKSYHPYNFQKFVVMLAYILFAPTTVEKMFKSFGNKMILEKFSKVEIIEDKGKMIKTFGITPEMVKIIKRINCPSLTECLPKLQQIDNNYALHFLEVLDTYHKLNIKFEFIRKLTSVDFNSMIDNIIFLIEKGYDYMALMKYLIRESIMFEKMRFFDQTFITLVDYVRMSEGFKFEKFPVYLEKAHYIIRRNTNVLNDLELVQHFNTSVQALKAYEVIGKDYSLIAPKDAQDLAREGNMLNHCVVNYMKQIANNEKIVLFLRETSNLDQPFMTVEITHSKKIIQVKQINNQNVEPAYINEVKNLLKEIC